MKEVDTKYYLGIDWGRRRIGIAIADEEMKIASSLGDVEIEEFESKLKELRADYNIVKVVIGKNRSSEVYDDNQEFIDKFAEKITEKGLEVVFSGEMFSTQEARKNLSKREGRIGSDNGEAARIILQSWIDK